MNPEERAKLIAEKLEVISINMERAMKLCAKLGLDPRDPEVFSVLFSPPLGTLPEFQAKIMALLEKKG